MQRSARMKREMSLLETSPPHGISCWLKEDNLEELEAQILGGDETPYAGGVFKLSINIPQRYPFEPPKVRFVTPIYHPNIDSAGRICLDSLKMPPKGAWKPALNISTLLTTIQLLMAEPNPDDPLIAQIADEFKHDKCTFEQKAKEWTKRYASQNQEAPPSDCSVTTEDPPSQNSLESALESTSTGNLTSVKRSIESSTEKVPLQDTSNKRPKP